MPSTPPQLMADNTIGVSKFVKFDATEGKANLATANSQNIGVSQEGTRIAPLSDLVSATEAAQAGEMFRLYGQGDICLVECGTTVAYGDKLVSDANGDAEPMATSGATLEQISGVALQAGVDGEKILIQVQLYSEVSPS